MNKESKLTPITTTLDSDNVDHIKGRTYTIKVDKGHRPAQMPKGVVLCVDEDEVVKENLDQFSLRYIPQHFEDVLRAIFGDAADTMSFNEQLEVAVEYAKINADAVREHNNNLLKASAAILG